jgi:Zn-dependent protease with chaperone function
MYIPLCIFFDGTSPKGQMAETELNSNAIHISYTTSEGEKKEIDFDYATIRRIIRRPNDKLLILFATSPQQMVEVRAMPQVVAFLKMTGHNPEYNSPFDILNTGSGKVLKIIGIILALVLCLYFYIIPFAADLFAQNLPQSYEISLGNKIYNQIIANDSIDTLKTTLVNRFAKQIDFNTDYHIQITVVHGDVVNAFATPGGHIIIYDTLLNQLENPDELAGLLSHEATHIKERHSLRAISSDLSRSLFLSILFHDQNSISSVLVANANMLNTLRFSREMERIADEGAVKIMLKNNIDPDGMVQLLNLLKREDKANGSLTYLSSHPATDERIKDVGAFIDNYNIRIIQNKERNNDWIELKKHSKKQITVKNK